MASFVDERMARLRFPKPENHGVSRSVPHPNFDYAVAG
jgi:hypothetical protein